MSIALAPIIKPTVAALANDKTFQIENVDNIIARIPKTRYYGSKRRLLTWIYLALKDLNFNTVLDGFGGTASVALLLKGMGKKVTFHDGLLFNTIAAQALLADTLPIYETTELHRFIEEISPRRGFISNTFPGMYYTDEENCWLDGAISAIEPLTDPLLRSIYLYCLFQACLKKRPFNLFHRANLNLRLNRDVKRTFNNHVTWETPFTKIMKTSLNELVHMDWPSVQGTQILPPGDITRLAPGYDLVYLDPPYVTPGRKSDDYLKRYHFLEGLCDYGNWSMSIDPASALKAFHSRPYLREWQDKRLFRDRLFDLVYCHRYSIVVLSYLEGAYPSREELVRYFKETFKEVRIFIKDFNHALAKEKKIEIMLIGEPY